MHCTICGGHHKIVGCLLSCFVRPDPNSGDDVEVLHDLCEDCDNKLVSAKFAVRRNELVLPVVSLTI